MLSMSYFQSCTINGGNSAFKQSFVDTGIKANLGDTIRVIVHPKMLWTNGQGNIVNANGLDSKGGYTPTPGPDPKKEKPEWIKSEHYRFPDGAVVGTWNDGESFIPIGQFCDFCVTSDMVRSKPENETSFKLAVWGNGGANQVNIPGANVAIWHGRAVQRFDFTKYNNPDFWIEDAKNRPNKPRYAGAFDVHARFNSVNANWVNTAWQDGQRSLKKTNIPVKVGEIITIVTDFHDSWNIGGNIPVSPCGQLLEHVGDDADKAWGVSSVLNGFRYAVGALCGTLDSGKWAQRTYFPVGSYLRMTALVEGSLELCMWDVDCENNGGTLTAYVSTSNYHGFEGYELGGAISTDLTDWGWNANTGSWNLVGASHNGTGEPFWDDVRERVLSD
jgi:hypothetical protein